jgi:HEAT repeat protein
MEPEEEALDSRGRNITLGIFGAIILLIVVLVTRNYMIKQDRIEGMKSNDAARQAAKVREMMQGFTNDGHVAEQLQGERPSVRMAAVRALQALATSGGTDEKTAKDAAKLTVPFLKDSDQPIKDQANQSLTAMGHKVAMEAVTNALGDGDNSVKGGAQSVVQNFGVNSLLPLLAFTDEGKKARLRTGHRTFAGNALYELSKKDERFKTVILLGEEAVQARKRNLSPEQAQEELAKLLTMDSKPLSAPADRIFGVVDYLDPLNANEDDQNNAISILDRVGDVRAVPYLIAKVDPPTTRRAAVGALGRLKDRRATDKLVSYLPEDETNRVDLVIALGRIADPRATAALIQHGLGSASRPVRAAAADSLRSIGAAAIPQLVAAATGSDPADPAFYKAEGAVRALAGMRIPGATQVAIGGLRHQSENVRESAAAGLADCADPAAIAPLISAFADKDGRVAGFAARSLSAFGSTAVAPLVAALSDANRVYWASMAIGYVGQAAIPALQQKVLTGDPAGARAAATLLGELGDPRAIETLQTALARRSDPDFQFAAGSSIQRLGGQAPKG